MNQLKFWKSGDPARSYSFLYSRPIQQYGAWVCTLTIHDCYESYSYTGITSLFVNTKLNTKYKARDIAISLFSSDIERTCLFPPHRIQKQIEEDFLDKPLSHKEDEEDPGVDDVTIIKRTPSGELEFVNELDRELEEYWAKRPPHEEIDEQSPLRTDSETEDFVILAG